MKKLVALALVCAMGCSLAACGSSSSSSSTTTTDDTVSAEAETETESSSDETASAEDTYYDVSMGFVDTNYFVTGFDVCMTYSMVMCQSGTTSLVYDSPFIIDENGDVTSNIFEEWEWQDDTHLYCKLYDDIYFSNGEKLTAEDILFTYQAILDGNFPIKFMMSFLDFDNWEISDDGLEVVIAMTECTPHCFGYLTYGILDKDYIESVGGENIDWYDPEQVVGSGPYTCTEYVQDSYQVFEVRDDYWGTAHGYTTTIDKLTCTLYNDNTTMMADYSSGIIDIAWGLTYDDYDSAEAGDYGNTELGLLSNNHVAWLVMDYDNGYTADEAVREAICYAVDADSIADVCFGSMAVYSEGALAVNAIGYTSDFQYDYDPDYAKSILEDAGYSDGEITLTYTYKSDDSTQTTVAEMVQSYLSDIGITVELNGEDETTYSTDETVDGYSNLAFYYMSNYTVDTGMALENWKSTGSNTVINRGGMYDDVIDSVSATTDTEAREEALYELQELWYENYDLVPLFEYSIAYAYNADTVPAGYFIPNMSGNLFYGQYAN
ncbi:MAG: ABC transporter substrate-binding protein [Clostridiales bacterium]|nr:ABC transporter substrate-binding protein [Clostridiales bacterium]